MIFQALKQRPILLHYCNTIHRCICQYSPQIQKLPPTKSKVVPSISSFDSLMRDVIHVTCRHTRIHVIRMFLLANAMNTFTT